MKKIIAVCLMAIMAAAVFAGDAGKYCRTDGERADAEETGRADEVD